MAAPIGTREDPAARIHAFKVHLARLPVSNEAQWILPIATEELYVHGDPSRAVRDKKYRLSEENKVSSV